MRLENLQLLNFKNYREARADFSGDVICFLGKNGSGKTNLLDAIHYLSFTRSGIQSGDSTQVRHGEEQFTINGRFIKDDKPFDVACSYVLEGKKRFLENGKEYGRLSQHLGKYPLVLVAPHDIELIWDGSEVRRKFFDTLFSQLDKEYLEHLIAYQAHLRQRNSLLRMVAVGAAVDRDLIASYDAVLVNSGLILFQKRKDFIQQYLPLLQARYNFLVKISPEAAGLVYQSDLEKIDFKKELSTQLDRDLSLGRTTVGVHRDDYVFTLDDRELKRFGSQGQQKSFLIGLKLAEFDCLKEKNKFNPILLMDDIFDKLDDDRIVQLMRLVSGGTFGQIFITDARPERSLEILKHAGVKSQNFLVDNGNLVASSPLLGR